VIPHREYRALPPALTGDWSDGAAY